MEKREWWIYSIKLEERMKKYNLHNRRKYKFNTHHLFTVGTCNPQVRERDWGEGHDRIKIAPSHEKKKMLHIPGDTKLTEI